MRGGSRLLLPCVKEKLTCDGNLGQGESCWAAGWLQVSFKLSQELTADRLLGPLTDHLGPESFSTRALEGKWCRELFLSTWLLQIRVVY